MGKVTAFGTLAGSAVPGRRREKNSSPKGAFDAPVRCHARCELARGGCSRMLAAAAAVLTLVAVPVTPSSRYDRAAASPSCPAARKGWAGMDLHVRRRIQRDVAQHQPVAAGADGRHRLHDRRRLLREQPQHHQRLRRRPQPLRGQGADVPVRRPRLLAVRDRHGDDGIVTQAYGAFEVNTSSRPPPSRGCEETFWLYPQNLTFGAWPASGEIDFAEFYSRVTGYEVPYVHYNSTARTASATSTSRSSTRTGSTGPPRRSRCT